MALTGHIDKFIGLVSDITPKYDAGVQAQRTTFVPSVFVNLGIAAGTVSDKTAILNQLKNKLEAAKRVTPNNLKKIATTFIKFAAENNPKITSSTGQCEKIFSKLGEYADAILETREKLADAKLTEPTGQATVPTTTNTTPAPNATPAEITKKATAADDTKTKPETYEAQFNAWSLQVEIYIQEIESHYAEERKKQKENAAERARLATALTDTETATNKATKELKDEVERLKKSLADEQAESGRKFTQASLDEKINSATEAMQKSLEAQQASATRQNEQYVTLDASFKKLEQSYMALRSEHRTVINELSALRVSNATKEKSTREYNALSLELTQTNQKLVVAQQNHAALIKEFQALTIKYNQLHAEALKNQEEFTRKIIKFSEKHKTLITTQKQTESLLTTTQASNVDLETHITTLLASRNALQSELDKTKATLNTRDSELKKTRLENQRLHTLLETEHTRAETQTKTNSAVVTHHRAAGFPKPTTMSATRGFGTFDHFTPPDVVIPINSGASADRQLDQSGPGPSGGIKKIQ